MKPISKKLHKKKADVMKFKVGKLYRVCHGTFLYSEKDNACVNIPKNTILLYVSDKENNPFKGFNKIHIFLDSKGRRVWEYQNAFTPRNFIVEEIKTEK